MKKDNIPCTEQLLCSVCGQDMNGNVGISISLMSDPSSVDNPERDKLIAMFGTSEIKVCYCCWFKSLGVKPVNPKDYILKAFKGFK